MRKGIFIIILYLIGLIGFIVSSVYVWLDNYQGALFSMFAVAMAMAFLNNEYFQDIRRLTQENSLIWKLAEDHGLKHKILADVEKIEHGKQKEETPRKNNL
jgi:hypothetical protein